MLTNSNIYKTCVINAEEISCKCILFYCWNINHTKNINDDYNDNEGVPFMYINNNGKDAISSDKCLYSKTDVLMPHNNDDVKKNNF